MNIHIQEQDNLMSAPKAAIPAIAFCILTFAISTSSALADTSCKTWSEIKPYLWKFYEVEGEHRDNLVSNFNNILPKTNYDPDVIGYTQSADGEHIKLHIFDKGCLVVHQHYPQLAIWSMMKARSVSVGKFDKSGSTYTNILAERDAMREKLRSKSPDDPSQDSPDIAPLNDGTYGDMD